MTRHESAQFQAALADRYVIDRVIGRGGAGTVYLARDVKHSRQVAIKAVAPEATARLGAKRFLREIRLTARLQHPHILPLLDSGAAGGCLYYVMPYVKGGSLRDRLTSTGRLPLREALTVFRGVAGALGYAHHNFLLHCDLKPENILMSEGHAVLADFGIARAIGTASHPWRAESGAAAGTAEYISPEQATGEREIDARSDVYGLACVLHEMLAGEAPFTGATDAAAIARRFTEPIPDVRIAARSVPSGIARAIKKALALDPRQRHRSVAKLVRDVEYGAVVGRSPLTPLRIRVWGVVSRLRAVAGGAIGGPLRRLAIRSRRTWEVAGTATGGASLPSDSLAG